MMDGTSPKVLLVKFCHEKNADAVVGADEAPRGLHRRQDMRGALAEVPQPGARG